MAVVCTQYLARLHRLNRENAYSTDFTGVTLACDSGQHCITHGKIYYTALGHLLHLGSRITILLKILETVKERVAQLSIF